MRGYNAGCLHLIFLWGTILLVSPIFIPATLGGGERSKGIVTGQELFLPGVAGARCSLWRAGGVDLRDACAKRVGCIYKDNLEMLGTMPSIDEFVEEIS